MLLLFVFVFVFVLDSLLELLLASLFMLLIELIINWGKNPDTIVNLVILTAARTNNKNVINNIKNFIIFLCLINHFSLFKIGF